MLDFFPGRSASATAVNNLVRCTVGAAGVSAIQPLINQVGETLAFPILAGITLALTPLIAVEWIYGEGWRAQRALRTCMRQEQERLKSAGH